VGRVDRQSGGTGFNDPVTISSATVGVFTLGGTIAMSPTDAGGGVVPRLGAADLVRAVPALEATGIGVRIQDVRRLPGPSLGFADLAELLAAVDAELTAGTITGAVVTQGTDTIEETSWLLDLLHGADAPLVVTGAMRNPSVPGADGPANLLAAVQVAADPAARDLGVVVVFGDDVHAARSVRKAHSTSVTAFTSPESGPIGHVSEGGVQIWHRPARSCQPWAARARESGRLERPRVALVPMTLGQDDSVIRAVSGHVDGLVVAGFGVGHVPARVVDAVTELAARIPVVLATRIGVGPVAAGTYAYPGSESDLLARGLIRAGYLDPYKARILLQVLLAAEADDDGVRRAFAEVGRYPVK
jgi:L-asparaginase